MRTIAQLAPRRSEAGEKHMPHKYVVVRAPEGEAEEYLGAARTLDEARKLIRAHEAGDLVSTPEHLWESARAAGHDVPGCSAPPIWYAHSAEPVEWAGRDGYYAIVRRPLVIRAE